MTKKYTRIGKYSRRKIKIKSPFLRRANIRAYKECQYGRTGALLGNEYFCGKRRILKNHHRANNNDDDKNNKRMNRKIKNQRNYSQEGCLFTININYTHVVVCLPITVCLSSLSHTHTDSQNGVKYF